MNLQKISRGLLPSIAQYSPIQPAWKVPNERPRSLFKRRRVFYDTNTIRPSNLFWPSKGHVRLPCLLLFCLSFICPGLDFPQIQHVINYDMPEDIENYVHRIGRTGRGKDKGRATTLINKSVDSAGMLTDIQLWTNFLFIYNSSQSWLCHSFFTLLY